MVSNDTIQPSRKRGRPCKVRPTSADLAAAEGDRVLRPRDSTTMYNERSAPYVDSEKKTVIWTYVDRKAKKNTEAVVDHAVDNATPQRLETSNAKATSQPERLETSDTPREERPIKKNMKQVSLVSFLPAGP
jgi:hypothetical protein